MRLWQLCRLAGLLDREPPRPVTSLQVLETIDRNTTSTRGELQQTRLLFRVPLGNALPEVFDDRVALSVATVVGVLLPVVDINVRNTSNEEFKLTLIKDINQLRWNQFVETSNECLELLLNSLLDTPFGNEAAAGLAIGAVVHQ